MTATAPERRRITLLGDRGPVDLAVPVDEFLADAVRRGGIAVDPTRDLIVDRGGYAVDLDLEGEALEDGGVYAIVRAPSGPLAARRARAAAAAARRTAHGAGWWLFAAVPIPAFVLVTAAQPGTAVRVTASLLLAVAAVAIALAWSANSGTHGAPSAAAMIGPLAAAAAAGALAIPPHVEASGHLQTVAALVATTVLALLLAVTDRVAAQRAAWGAISTLLLGLVAIWGVALLTRGTVVGAAAVSLGAVPLVLRALPSTLVNVPDGYFIDYRHFMSNRWSVRGTVPASPGAITSIDAERLVQASNARLVAGTLLLSAVAAVCAPFAAVAVADPDPVVSWGGVGLVVCSTLALLLVPRHTTGRLLRWVPRGAAVAVLALGAIGSADRLGTVGATVGAGILLVLAFVSALMIVPVARGASSLVWSRAGDTIEWIVVALALPTGLLAANSIELLRGMMGG